MRRSSASSHAWRRATTYARLASAAWLVGAVALGALGALGAAGCDKGTRPDAGDPPTSPSTLARRLGLDAADLAPEPSDPVAPAGNLREEAATFTTLEACVVERAAKLDPLFGDAVRAIGYDTLFYDGCRTVQAAKERDARLCEPIVSSALKARCETLAAIARGDADACPRVDVTTVAQGRSPTCLAAAAGDARLCAGEPKISRIHCEALVLRDEHRCEWVPDDALQPGMGRRSCLRELQRLRALLPELHTNLAPLVTPKATLRVTYGHARGGPDALLDAGRNGGAELDAGREPPVDATSDVERGAVIFPAYARRDLFDRTRLAVELGDLVEPTPGFLASSPTRAPRLALLVSFGKGGVDARVERAELVLPGARTRVYPSERMKSAVTVTKLEAHRGGELSLRFSGEIDGVTMGLEVTTFVRDVVTQVPSNLPSSLLAATPPSDLDAGPLAWPTKPSSARDAQ